MLHSKQYIEDQYLVCFTLLNSVATFNSACLASSNSLSMILSFSFRASYWSSAFRFGAVLSISDIKAAILFVNNYDQDRSGHIAEMPKSKHLKEGTKYSTLGQLQTKDQDSENSFWKYSDSRTSLNINFKRWGSYSLKSPWIFRSFSRSFGPVLYQPTTCSFAEIIICTN